MSSHHLDRAANLRIDRSLKLVLMAIADDADRTTGLAFPGQEKLQLWAGLGKSQTAAVLAQLIDLGYLERVELGRKGRRTTYRVFAKVACCPEHAPLNADPEPVDNSPVVGSGPPDPNPLGSGIGSGEGSGPAPDPSVSLNLSSTREGPTGAVGAGEVVHTRPDPSAARCAGHAGVDDPPACGACARARERAEDAARVYDLAEASRRAIRRRAEGEALAAAIRRCTLCDEHGQRGLAICSHDAAQAARDARGAAEARARLAAVREAS